MYNALGSLSLLTSRQKDYKFGGKSKECLKRFSLEEEEIEKLGMNNEVISETIDGIEEAKTHMENKLIWRKVESKESQDDSLDEKEMNEIEDSEEEKEVIEKEQVDTLSETTGSRGDNPVWNIENQCKSQGNHR